VKGKINENNSENFPDRNLTTEYQLCKYVNHTVGMKSRQPNEPCATTSKSER